MSRLPNELLAMIIALLADSTTEQTQGALVAVSEVSSCLRDIALPHLFRAKHVTCKPPQDTIQDFHTFLLENPHLAEHVQELTLDGTRNAWREDTVPLLPAEQLRDIFNCLPRLHTLHIHNMEFVPPAAICTPTRELRALHLFYVEISSYGFQHILALFTRVQRAELYYVMESSRTSQISDTPEVRDVYPPLLSVGQVRTQLAWPLIAYVLPFANKDVFVEPVTEFEFVLHLMPEVRDVGEYMEYRGESVKRLEMVLVQTNDMVEQEPRPNPYLALKRGFPRCIALTHLHIHLPISLGRIKRDRTVFVKLLDTLNALPDVALQRLTLELFDPGEDTTDALLDVPLPDSALEPGEEGKDMSCVWDRVGAGGWAKLGEVCDRFRSLEGLGLMDTVTGGPVLLEEDMRAQLEGLGVKVVPVWREPERSRYVKEARRCVIS